MPLRKRIHTTASDKFPAQITKKTTRSAAPLLLKGWGSICDQACQATQKLKVLYVLTSAFTVVSNIFVEIELTLFSYMDLRQAPPSPVDGRPQKRASMSEVECLLADI